MNRHSYLTHLAQIADDLRHLLEKYDQVVPTVLEIPTKNHPYDPSKDFMMTRLKRMMGGGDDGGKSFDRDD